MNATSFCQPGNGRNTIMPTTKAKITLSHDTPPVREIAEPARDVSVAAERVRHPRARARIDQPGSGGRQDASTYRITAIHPSGVVDMPLTFGYP
jgi:hypothetical protein